jgi:hypothetical protein
MSRFVLTRPGTCRICQRRLEAGTMVSWEKGKGIWCMDHDAPAPPPAPTNQDNDRLYLALDTIMKLLDGIQELLKAINEKLEAHHETKGPDIRDTSANQATAKGGSPARGKVANGDD